MARKHLNSKLLRDYSDLIMAGTAKNTRRAYDRDVNYFWVWARFSLKLRKRYPVNEEVVIQFILEHIQKMPKTVESQLIKGGYKQQEGPIKLSTVKRYLTSLSIVHQEKSKASPTQSPRVKILLRRAKNALADQEINKKAAITRDILNDMVETCDDSLEGSRDKAILLVGFSCGGRRRSEMANIQVSDLRKIKDGYMLRLRKSKTDQGGKGVEVPILGKAASGLTQWLVQSGIRSGFVFRGIHPKSGKLNDSICCRTINRIIKRRIEMIGLDPDLYGGHSLRSGFITEAARSGANIVDAMSLSGHKSIEIAHGYYREADVLSNPASNLLD